MTRRKLVNSLKAAINKIIVLELWRAQAHSCQFPLGVHFKHKLNSAEGRGHIASIMIRLKLVNFIEASIEKLNNYERWSAQAQIC